MVPHSKKQEFLARVYLLNELHEKQKTLDLKASKLFMLNIMVLVWAPVHAQQMAVELPPDTDPDKD